MNRKRTRPVIVVDYDPSWPRTFETLKSRILSVVGSVALGVEHVGSTAVPGLAAKPIIDLDVIVATAADVPIATERLATLGYLPRGNLGIPGREAFASPPGSVAHHMYVCVRSSTALANHLAIRDYLRRNAALAGRYGRLKKQLAEQFPTDRDRYIAGKTDFILAALREAGLPNDVLTAIDDGNRTSGPP